MNKYSILSAGKISLLSICCKALFVLSVPSLFVMFFTQALISSLSYLLKRQVEDAQCYSISSLSRTNMCQTGVAIATHQVVGSVSPRPFVSDRIRLAVSNILLYAEIHPPTYVFNVLLVVLRKTTIKRFITHPHMLVCI